MARGIKITNTTSGTARLDNAQQTDKYVSPTLVGGAHFGGTGGLTSQTGYQIQPAVKVGGASAGTGSIITQKGAHKFRVTDGTNVGICTLANKASGSLCNNEMSITVTKADTTTFYASRITNKYVWDFAGVRYRYHLAAATADFVQVARA